MFRNSKSNAIAVVDNLRKELNEVNNLSQANALKSRMMDTFKKFAGEDSSLFAKLAAFRFQRGMIFY